MVKEFYDPFNKSLEEFSTQSRELKKSLIEETDSKCEKCGKPMVIRWGKNGKFMACSGFPECRNTMPLEGSEPEVTDQVCEKCGSKMEVKRGRYGKFLACSNYPACKNVKPLNATGSISKGIKCPNLDCSGEIVQKKTKRGKIFFSCSEYPKCKFASWEKPVEMECNSCGSPTMIEKKDGSGLSCPRCGNLMPAVSKEEEAAVQ